MHSFDDVMHVQYYYFLWYVTNSRPPTSFIVHSRTLMGCTIHPLPPPPLSPSLRAPNPAVPAHPNSLLGWVASYFVYADVRFPISMTHRYCRYCTAR